MSFQRYLIGLLLSGDLLEWHDSIVAELAEEFGCHHILDAEIPAHITLKGTILPSTSTSVQELSTVLRNFTQELNHPHGVFRIKGYGQFPQGVAYLNVVHNDTTRELFTKFIDELKDRFPYMNWGPHDGVKRVLHTTLANYVGTDQLPEIMAYLNENHPDPIFLQHWNSLALLGEETNSLKWRVVVKFD